MAWHDSAASLLVLYKSLSPFLSPSLSSSIVQSSSLFLLSPFPLLKNLSHPFCRRWHELLFYISFSFTLINTFGAGTKWIIRTVRLLAFVLILIIPILRRLKTYLYSDKILHHVSLFDGKVSDEIKQICVIWIDYLRKKERKRNWKRWDGVVNTVRAFFVRLVQVSYGPNKRNSLDVYLLQDEKRGRDLAPVVVYIGGGGWTVGFRMWALLMAKVITLLVHLWYFSSRWNSRWHALSSVLHRQRCNSTLCRLPEFSPGDCFGHAHRREYGWSKRRALHQDGMFEIMSIDLDENEMLTFCMFVWRKVLLW